MAGKYKARVTRDIVCEIRMDALVVRGLPDGTTRQIAPPRVRQIPMEAGEQEFRLKRQRDSFVERINAEHPGAAVVA